jgi:hypothetical protein
MGSPADAEDGVAVRSKVVSTKPSMKNSLSTGEDPVKRMVEEERPKEMWRMD